MSERHLILHPVEAPTADLETVVTVRVPPQASMWAFVEDIPLQLVRCCAGGSLKVLAVTPIDAPCRASVTIRNGRFHCKIKLVGAQKRRPAFISVHVAGRSRTSPPAWEHHSRQQFTANRTAFKRALP